MLAHPSLHCFPPKFAVLLLPRPKVPGPSNSRDLGHHVPTCHCRSWVSRALLRFTVLSPACLPATLSLHCLVNNNISWFCLRCISVVYNYLWRNRQMSPRLDHFHGQPYLLLSIPLSLSLITLSTLDPGAVIY